MGSPRTVHDWIASKLHLPPWLRDFHDQKDAFKFLASHVHPETKGGPYDTPWTNAHCYVIDTFLRVMALCGYTLQRTGAKYEFANFPAEVEAYRAEMSKVFAAEFANRKAKAAAEGPKP